MGDKKFGHVALDLDIGRFGKILFESTLLKGFNYVHDKSKGIEFERIENVDLICAVLTDYAIAFSRNGEYIQAAKYLSRASKIDEDYGLLKEVSNSIFRNMLDSY